MTTAVYFDLDGTLVSYTESFDDLFARTLDEVVGNESVDDLEGATAEYTDRVLDALKSNRESPYEDAFGVVVGAYGLDADPAVLADEYVRREAAATRVPDGVADLVETVAAAHPTGILTNGDGRMQRRKLATHGLDALVDEILVSGELGVRKPDPEIFETAKRRLQADVHVYVGDTPEEDIQPAAERGFLTVRVRNDGASGPEPGTDGTTGDLNAPTTERLAAVLLALLAPDG